MPDSPAVVMRTDGDVARITVGSGVRHNALDGAGWTLLRRCVEGIGDTEESARDDAVRVAVISGHGDTFCAGSDMTEWIDAATDSVDDSFTQMEAAFTAVEGCPVPVVAKISGVAAGAGCQLALACDLRVMADSARIGMPIARLGILPSALFTARIVELAGPALARELLYTGRLLDAGAAVASGLANMHVPDAQLDAYAERLLRRIGDQPPAAIKAAKSTVSAVLRPTRDVGDGLNRRAVSETDFRHGINTFLDRS